LHNVAAQTKVATGTEHLNVVADRGYFRGPEIKASDEAGISTYLPKPQTSNNAAKGLFGKRDFVYTAETDTYRCTAGEQLTRRTKTYQGDLVVNRYWISMCAGSALNSKCTVGKERRVSRWEHE